MSTLHVYRNKTDHDFTLLLNLIPGIVFVAILFVFLFFFQGNKVLGTSISIDNNNGRTENLTR